jgi:hypothetical protein
VFSWCPKSVSDLKDHYNSTAPLLPYPGKSTTQGQWHPRPGLFSLQVLSGGEFGHEVVHVPFKLNALKEIKQDLGNFNENPDQYIQKFQELNQNFDMAWKDIMLLLTLTLTTLEKQWVLKQATIVGNNYYLSQSKTQQKK